MSDYDKIMQLLKSKDDYNILLGLQLAKGAGFKLSELFNNILFNRLDIEIRTFGCRIELDKTFRIQCCRKFQNGDWLFQISVNNVTEWDLMIPSDSSKKLWYESKEKCINKFINLITE